MALELLTTTAFDRDLRRVRKQGKDLDKLEAIVDLLQAQEPLPVRCRAHPLRANWAGHWDCQVEPAGFSFKRLARCRLIADHCFFLELFPPSV